MFLTFSLQLLAARPPTNLRAWCVEFSRTNVGAHDTFVCILEIDSMLYLEHFRVESSLLEPSPQHLPVYVVDGRDAGQDEVEDEEVPLEAVGYVVFAPSRVAHRGDVLQVLAHLVVVQ